MALQRFYDEAGGSRWIDTGPSRTDHNYEYAQRDSEAEILRSAFVSDEEFEVDPVNAGADFLDEVDDNRQLLEEMSQVEGFDGRELSDAEIAHRNIHGDRADGWDRPLELESLEQAADEIERLQEELAASNGAIDRLATGGTEIPQPIDQARAAARQQAAQQLYNAGMWDENQVNAMINAQENQSIERQFMEAKAEHGAEFDEAMNALHSLNPNNPRDRALVRGIAYASHAGSHAGEALMSWYRSSRATRQGRAHPQQQRTIRHGMLMDRDDNRRRGQAYRGLEQEVEDNGGYSSADDEADVFAAAFAEE